MPAFPIYHPPALFPTPTYASGIPSAPTAEAFASAPTTALPASSISPTSSLSSLAPLLPFDPDPEQGLVNSPDEHEHEDTKDEATIAAAAPVRAGRPKRKCVVASVVESAQTSPRKKGKKATVKPETESEESPGNESDFEPGDEAGGGAGRAKEGKRTTTERKERRKATNRASQCITLISLTSFIATDTHVLLDQAPKPSVPDARTCSPRSRLRSPNEVSRVASPRSQDLVLFSLALHSAPCRQGDREPPLADRATQGGSRYHFCYLVLPRLSSPTLSSTSAASIFI